MIEHVDVILLAAGRGERLGRESAKAEVPVHDAPLFVHSLRILASHPSVRRLILVGPPESSVRTRMQELARAELGKGSNGSIALHVLPGGAERQDSSRAAIDLLSELETSSSGIVLIHDAARPLLTVELIDRCLAALGQAADPAAQAAIPGIPAGGSWGPGPAGAIPGLPVRETLKLAFEGRIVMTQPREHVYAIQTPQAFRFGPLREAHRRAHHHDRNGTDDAALLEWLGMPVVLVPGDHENLKVTFPEDLELAALLLERRGGGVSS
jgi:2-C-methyl-D-erythritol 4-phosphate cytidylyltransferase